MEEIINIGRKVEYIIKNLPTNRILRDQIYDDNYWSFAGNQYQNTIEWRGLVPRRLDEEV